MFNSKSLTGVAGVVSLLLVCVGVSSGSVVARAQNGKQRSTTTQEQPTIITAPRVAEPPVSRGSLPPEWKQYRYKFGDGDTLSLILPGKPEEAAESETVVPGAVVTTHTAIANNSNGVYMAGYIELPRGENAKITPEAKRLIFQQFWQYFAKGIQQGLEESGLEAKLTAQPARRVTISGRDGQEQDFSVGKMAGRYRAVIDGLTIYMAVSMTMPDGSVEERTAFFDSFEILPIRR